MKAILITGLLLLSGAPLVVATACDPTGSVCTFEYDYDYDYCYSNYCNSGSEAASGVTAYHDGTQAEVASYESESRSNSTFDDHPNCGDGTYSSTSSESGLRIQIWRDGEYTRVALRDAAYTYASDTESCGDYAGESNLSGLRVWSSNNEGYKDAVLGTYSNSGEDYCYEGVEGGAGQGSWSGGGTYAGASHSDACDAVLP